MSCTIIHSPKFIQIDTNHMVMFALWSFSCLTTKKLVTLNYIQYKDKRCKSCWMLFFFHGLLCPKAFVFHVMFGVLFLRNSKFKGSICMLYYLVILHQKTKEKVVPCFEKKKGLSLRKKVLRSKNSCALAWCQVSTNIEQF